MDLTPILIGAAIGVVTGLVPGLHVNTLAALALAAAPDASTALGLLAVGTVHTFVSILPATYLGAPDDDTALTLLPAHQMLLAGRAPEAVRLSLHASLAALVVVLLVAMPYKWLLAEPLRAEAWLRAIAPWILGGVLVLLIALERPGGRVAAAFVGALAGVLGLVTRSWPLQALVPVPASVLLPLLTGLFAAPTLLAAARQDMRPPEQVEAPPRLPKSTAGDVLLGTGAAAFTAVLPGLTAAVATSIARMGRRTDDPRPIIATLSAVNTAHMAFSLLVLWIIGTTRSGLADAVRPTLLSSAWTRGIAPTGLHQAVFSMLAAGLLAVAATRLLEPVYRRATLRWSGRNLHHAVLVVLVVLVTVLSGPWGLAVFAVATIVGQVPLELGVRRVHLAASLIVPAIGLAAG